MQFEGFGGDYVFWAGSAQSEGRRHTHPRIKSPPESGRRCTVHIYISCVLVSTSTMTTNTGHDALDGRPTCTTGSTDDATRRDRRGSTRSGHDSREPREPRERQRVETRANERMDGPPAACRASAAAAGSRGTGQPNEESKTTQNQNTRENRGATCHKTTCWRRRFRFRRDIATS